MFRSMFSGGFQIDFENGYVVSLQFGDINYCDNNNLDRENAVECPDAELAIFKWINNRRLFYITDKFASEILGIEIDDAVMGFITPEIAAKAILWTSIYNKGV